MKKHVISFDFDGVIHKSVIRGTPHPINFDKPDTWIPFEKIHRIMDELSETCTIVVVTKRLESMRKDTQFYLDAYDLPVDKLICTNGMPKWDILHKIGTVRHYDDDINMLDEYDDNENTSSIEFYHVDPETEKIEKV